MVLSGYSVPPRSPERREIVVYFLILSLGSAVSERFEKSMILNNVIEQRTTHITITVKVRTSLNDSHTYCHFGGV
jgi:hypothetical protein